MSQFTNKKTGIARDMNHALLEKVRYLFWAEAIVYASYLLNKIPMTGIGVRLHWRFGQVELLVTMIRLEYSVV